MIWWFFCSWLDFLSFWFLREMIIREAKVRNFRTSFSFLSHILVRKGNSPLPTPLDWRCKDRSQVGFHSAPQKTPKHRLWWKPPVDPDFTSKWSMCIWLFKFPCLDSRLSFYVSLMTYFIFFLWGFFFLVVVIVALFFLYSRLFLCVSLSKQIFFYLLTFTLSLDLSWIFFSLCVCSVTSDSL